MTAILKPEIARYHMDVLNNHNTTMFNSLIQPHHVTSGNLKEIEFDGFDSLRGYFAQKDKEKWWIKEEDYGLLPIRVKEYEELKHKEDVVFNPTSVSSFKIEPEQRLEVRQMIDDFVPFKNTHPDQWFIMKLVALVSYTGRTFICVATEPGFGKSGIYRVLNAITSKTPVFKPRSIPGVLNKITSTGVIVFDEAHKSKKEVKEIMEEFTLCLGDGSPEYINGAMKSHRTQNNYDCILQSITYLYNNINCYKNPEKDYFEMIFSNNKAIDDRLLKLKLDGKLTQSFTRDFDIESVAIENKMYYIDFMKTLLWLQEYKQTGDYELRYMNRSILKLDNRKQAVYNEILWLLDMYCVDQKEFDKYVGLIDQAVISYKEMVSVFNETDHEPVEEEEIK